MIDKPFIEEVYEAIKSFGDKGTYTTEAAKKMKREHKEVKSAIASLMEEGRIEDLGKHGINGIFVERFYRVKK